MNQKYTQKIHLLDRIIGAMSVYAVTASLGMEPMAQSIVVALAYRPLAAMVARLTEVGNEN